VCSYGLLVENYVVDQTRLADADRGGEHAWLEVGDHDGVEVEGGVL
jgi:hypothetical protein